MIIRWGYFIPEPDDGWHLEVWFSFDGGKLIDAFSYQVAYDVIDRHTIIDLLEYIYPGMTVEFTCSKADDKAQLPYEIDVARVWA